MVNRNVDGDDAVADEFGGDRNAGGRGTQGRGGGGQTAPGGVPHGDAVGRETSTGLDENVAGALSYLLGVLTGVLFFVLEPDNRFVRFHAAQSMVVFGGVFVLSIVLSAVGGIATAVLFSGGTGGFFVGSIVSLVLGLVWLVLSVGALAAWLYLMFKAYKGETPRVPVAAGIADRLVN